MDLTALFSPMNKKGLPYFEGSIVEGEFLLITFSSLHNCKGNTIEVDFKDKTITVYVQLYYSEIDDINHVTNVIPFTDENEVFGIINDADFNTVVETVVEMMDGTTIVMEGFPTGILDEWLDEHDLKAKDIYKDTTYETYKGNKRSIVERIWNKKLD